MSQNADLPIDPKSETTTTPANPRPQDRLSTVRVEIEIAPEVTRTLKFPPNSRILIGRSDDEETASDLMLDFAPFDGEKNGVSRVHAAITDQDGLVFMTDLASTNGTRINGLELIAQQPCRLYDGDEIEFGSARVTVLHIGRS